jgi:O-antigen/teichoic acid export membrane protein
MIKRSIVRVWQHFVTDNLFRNSIYLMLNTGIQAALGFLFWLIAAHIFTSDQIGVGTALISAMTLISFVSLLGFNSTFVRVLPNSKNRNEEINTGSILVISTAAILAIFYIWLIPYITPSLAIVHANFWYMAGFVVMVALASINALTDSIFIAYRAAQYNLITDGLFTSGSKILLPFIFLGLGAYGVFASAGLAASIGMVASITFLVVKFGYRPEWKINKVALKNVFSYLSANYVANLVNIIPTLILPIIILDHLGATAAANYYLAFAVINLLYAVSISVSQSLFAEGSYGEDTLRDLLKHAAIILGAIMIPAAAILGGFGPFILGFFGKSYSEGGARTIVILAIASPLVAAYNIGNTLLKIRRQIRGLITVNVAYALTVSGLAILLINKGLTWVALAWTAGNFIAAALAFLFIFLNRQRATPVNVSG